MMKSKRILACLLVTLLTICASFSAFAAGTLYELPEAGLTLELPEGTFVFTPNTPDDDPSWNEAGLNESVKYKTEYTTLGTLAHFSSDNGKTNVYVGKKETDTTKSYFNLASLTEEQMETFLGMYNSEEKNVIKSSAVLYEHAQVPFLKITIQSFMEEAIEEGVAFESVYFTIVNGYSVSFSQHGPTAFTDADTAFMKQLVDSIQFVNLQDKPQVDPAAVQQALLAIGVIVAFVLAIILALVISRVNAKRRKDANRRLAERLSQYRKDKANKEPEYGTPLFENVTEHTDSAIRVYSQFYTFVKKPMAPIVSIVVSILGAIFSVWLSGEWWMTLLMIAAAIFCTFKFVTGATAMEKALRRVYGNMRSRKNKYVFYADEFTISGTQSTGSYPYFQITGVDEWKDYYYLYFGEGNPHFVSKKSFSIGEAAAFKKFILDKNAKNKER